MNSFKVIIYTLPNFIDEEADVINDLCDSGLVDYIHIRKPDADIRQVRELLKKLSSSSIRQVKLHDCFDLTKEFDVCGVHLNSRCSVAPSSCKSISTSFHSVDELTAVDDYDYVTLSPIYDSISKAGYTSSFNLDTLYDKIYGKPVIALGGVTPSKFKELKDKGFAGAAMLGYAWSKRAIDLIKEINDALSQSRQM